MVFDTPIITHSSQETAAIGQELADYLVKVHSSQYTVHSRGQKKVASIVCLYGELGSGKTTFVQGFARGLGITARLLSPTFVIVRRYHLRQYFRFLYHIDCYRLSSAFEQKALGLSEIFADSNSVVAVEWADTLGRLLPRKRIDVHFTVENNESHRAKVQIIK